MKRSLIYFLCLVSAVVIVFAVRALNQERVWTATASAPAVSLTVATSSLLATNSEQPTTTSSIEAASSTTIAEASESTSTRLLFVGDIMLDRKVADRIRVAHDPLYPFRHLPIGWFSSFDGSIANVEGPFVQTRVPSTKVIDFRFDPALIPALKSTGLSIVSQANNHSLDQGKAGAAESTARLRQAGFVVFGHETRDDPAIAYATTTIQGVRFAFVGFNTTEPFWNQDMMAKTMQAAHRSADHVIVCMHWGVEYHDHPTIEQQTLGRWLIDQGADVVIGGHPHWVESIESYHGHPIVYSLGNFVFDQDFSKETEQGLGVEVDMTGGHMSLKFWPLAIEASQPRVMEGPERQRALDDLASISDVSLKQGIEQGEVQFSF